MALVVCLGAALVAAAPASSGSPVNPPGSTQALGAMLAVQQANLTAADGGLYDYFGYSVAIAGDTAVVGAYGADVGADTDQGSAYVFVRSGATWSQQAKLTASGSAAFDYFGYSVAIAGDTAVVGAIKNDVGGSDEQGSAYVFVRSGATWSQQAQLTAADGVADDYFGWSVAITGDTAVVGARYDEVGGNDRQGSAYVFVRSGATWSQQAKLVAADGAADDKFGHSVAIAGDTAVVGACHDDVGGNENQGSAYVFVRSGAVWSQQAQFTAAAGAPYDCLGWSVTIAGDTVVFGAPFDDVGASVDRGSAYVFARSGATWSQQAMLTAGDLAAHDCFGYSVAISDTAVAVGTGYVGARADRGSAYVFARSGATWSQQAKLTAADRAAYDCFGHSVAISRDTSLVGAPKEFRGANLRRGSAYTFLVKEVAKPGKPTPTSPKGLISSRTPTIKWKAVAGAASYEVGVYKGSKLLKQKTAITKTSWKCTTRLPRKVWLTWKVRARNAVGAGPWSATLRFKVR
jgi:hypothetical protein